MVYSNGDKYEGEWLDNAKNGVGKLPSHKIGTMEYDNGDKYVGDWKDDKRDGTGSSDIKPQAHSHAPTATNMKATGKTI